MSRRGLRWTGPGATWVLGLLCLVLAAALGAGIWWERQPVTVRPSAQTPITSLASRDAALQVAGPLTERVLSYTWEDFDRRVDEVSGLLTGSYARQYDDQVAGLRESVVTGRVTVSSSATQVGVVSAAQDRAVALVFLDRVSATQGSPAQRRDQVRVLVTVARDGREWRVARLDSF